MVSMNAGSDRCTESSTQAHQGGGGGDEEKLVSLQWCVVPRPYHPVPRADMEALVVGLCGRGTVLPLESQPPAGELPGIVPCKGGVIVPVQDVPS